MNIATSRRVAATTAAKATVSLAWRVRGAKRRSRRSSSRGSEPRPRTGERRVRARRAAGASIVRSSALGKGVTDPADGLDEDRPARIVLDLVAQVAHVDVDRLLVLIEGLVVAEQVEQLGAGVDPAGSAGQVAEDLELGWREADPAIPPLDAAAIEIDDQVVMPQHTTARGIGQVAVRPSQEGLDAAEQLP